MNFYTRTGKMAIGTRLRRLSEKVTEDAARIYRLYDIDFQPRWFPVFYILSEEGEQSISVIARAIGHTHVSVSQIVKEMTGQGLVSEERDKNDGRKTLVALSKKSKDISKKIKDQYKDVNDTIEKIHRQTNYNLWKAIEEWEHLLEHKSLLNRVTEQKKTRESRQIQIVPYRPKYQKDFRSLNEQWISKYFKMEQPDLMALDHPQKYILNKGGSIIMALYQGKAVGTCALLKMGNGIYELAKMAVSPKAQGKGIGQLFGEAIIEKARKLRAKKIYLESNTILKPAISLYYKLGFKKVVGYPSPYKRCDIQMELVL